MVRVNNHGHYYGSVFETDVRSQITLAHIFLRIVKSDRTGITLNFASEGGGAMMGVFSGHGVHGQQCANFSQRVLPQQLAKFVRQKRVQKYKTILQSEGNAKKGAWSPKLWPLLSKGEYEGCCKLAFHETNKMMHEEIVVSTKE